MQYADDLRSCGTGGKDQLLLDDDLSSQRDGKEDAEEGDGE